MTASPTSSVFFEGLDFIGNTAQGDDLIGDAYEYLMRIKQGMMQQLLTGKTRLV